MAWLRAAALALGGLFLLLAGFPAFAQNASPRGAVHDGYGRLVFDWDGPVNYSADIVNGQLVVRFDRPASGDFRRLGRPLSKYVGTAIVSPDRKTVTFPLTHPVQVKSFLNQSGSVVIDLVDETPTAQSAQSSAPTASVPATPAASTAQAQSQPAPSQTQGADGAKDGAPVSLLPSPGQPAPAPAPETKKPASEKTPAAPSSSSALDIRTGEHGSYNRIVFTWPKTVGYTVSKDGDKAVVRFAKSAPVDAAALRNALPSDIALASADSAAGATTVTLTLPKGARLRHFPAGNKVVLDVVRDASSPAPTGLQTLPAGTENEPGQPSLKPLTQQDRPRLPSETLPTQEELAKMAQAASTAAATPEPPKPPEKPAPAAPEKAPPQAAEPPPPSPAAMSASQPPPVASGEIYSLSVSWDKPVAAAVFQRAGYLWLVFDRHQEVDTKLLRRMGGPAVTFAEQVKGREATILRLIVQPEFQPSLRRDGLLWVIDLMRQSGEPKQPIPVVAPAALSTGTGIALNIADAGGVVQVNDPEVGDTMLVVPVIPLGAGVYPGHDTPEVELLATTQGIALLPHLDGLDVKSSRTGVTIGSPVNGGLRLSAQPTKKETPAADNTALFDIPTWQRGGADHFEEERRLVNADLAAAMPNRRPAAHMSAARFYFANGYAAEALGLLRIAALDEPTMVDTPPFRALRGAANAYMGRYDLASFDLDSPLLKDDSEARFWQAIAHAGRGDDLVALEKDLARGLPIIKAYPKKLRWPLALVIANAALAASDDATSQAAIQMIDGMVSSPMEKGAREYLLGLYAEMQGRFDKALDFFVKAEKTANREIRARAALAEVELRLKSKTISPKEAMERLDRLRFAWRDEDFEFALLKRLAEMQVLGGDYGEALRSLRALANYYPNNKGAPQITKSMQDIFEKLYLGGGADSLPPITAIGLYDEFRDLTPTGARGDEMIRKLADRLVTVDLLDRAAELLKHQVNYRLQGLDKLRVGTQLTVLDLLDHRPNDALDALAASELDNAPADIAQQRRLLKASALSQANRADDAITLLAGDPSPDAALLRAEIYWKKQDWPNAATAFAALVDKPADGVALDDASAKLVLNWATALVLANDEAALGALRRNFGTAMDQTPYKDGFRLLSSSLERDVPDLRAVGRKIKEVENFRTFLGDYRARLQKGGVSAIN